MEFPFGGHHHRHHHHHRNEDEEEEEYPPPSSHHHHHLQHNTPPPPSFGTTVESHQHYGGPPPNYMYEQEDMYQRQQPPPPPQPDFSGYSSVVPPGAYSSSVQHVSHDFNHHHHHHHHQQQQQRFEPEDPSEFRHETHHHHTLHHHSPPPPPPPASFVYHHTHETGVPGNDFFNNNINLPTVRVYSKAEPRYSLTIRDGRVILAPSDPTDVFQHWIKDEKYSIKVKDEEGFPSFSLVNKATGQAIKHSIGATHPVQLRPYNPDDLDESVLWSESRDLGDGFRTVRMVNNICLNLDAFHGDKNHGGVHDGTTIVLWEWKKGDNQRWRIVCY